MSQSSFDFADAAHRPSLMVRESTGVYRDATNDEILLAASNAIDARYTVGCKFDEVKDTVRFFRAKLAGYRSEVFAAAFLNTNHQLLGYHELFRGSISGSEVHPREIVKACIHFNASAILLSHLHPSGNPTPSRCDIAVTRRISDALALIDVRVLDHIVIAGNRYSSFANEGLLHP